MRIIRSFLIVWAVAVFAAAANAAISPLPAKPADYVLDEVGVLSADERRALSEELEQFERDTSNQIVVAVMPRVPDDYVMEDFTQRTAEAWGGGQKDRENGIVLFVFPEQREMRIEVGYGLEGAVPDALANQIIQDEIVPSFRAGDMPSGIARGVQALMAASKGEYTGTGRTVADEEVSGEAMINLIIFIIFVIFVIISIRRSKARGGHVYDSSGPRDVWFPSSGSGLGGGGFGGGSGGGFGGGGFSGGGGGFGGGGASGRW